jgi:hypothetical protein
LIITAIGFAILIPGDCFDDGTPPVEPVRVAVADVPKLVEKLRRAESERMTLEEYNALQNGMSYEQVVKIIGKEGQELSRRTIDWIPTVIYQWQNAGPAEVGVANALFENGKLVQKSQLNLN